mgnify:CR=1 FL=1
MARGPASIARTDRRRVVNVMADVDDEEGNTNEILADLRGEVLPRMLSDYPDIRYSLEGQQQEQRETMSGLMRGFAIALLVIFASWQLLRETVGVLMEAAPGHIDVDEVRRALCETRGVLSIHDLHVWTITSGFISLSCHVESSHQVPDHELLTTFQGLLHQRFGIDHVTIQIEPAGFEGKARVC